MQKHGTLGRNASQLGTHFSVPKIVDYLRVDKAEFLTYNEGESRDTFNRGVSQPEMRNLCSELLLALQARKLQVSVSLL